MATAVAPARKPLTGNQIRGFWASWLGLALDGMDSFIYALVLVPALKDLLQHSGITPTPGAIGYYGGMQLALFLIGWGCSLLFGPIGDRFGRVRTLTLTILFYSAFTFLGAVAVNVWQLAIFRLLAGMGIGGEWTLAVTFVAEEWPEDRRKMGGGLLHTGYYFGFFLAAVANYTIGAHYGWRAMFALGGAPALLIGWIRRGVKEPQSWQSAVTGSRPAAIPARDLWAPLSMLFSPLFRRRTILNFIYLLVSTTGLWAGSVYLPAAVTFLAARAGYSDMRAAQLASWATMLLSAGTITGCLAVPAIAERIGRRATLALFFALMFTAIFGGFGWAFYLEQASLRWFFAFVALLGFGGANFCVYTLWLPEQYPTACRASAYAFAVSGGRFLVSGVTFLVGAAVTRYHTIGAPVAWTSVAFAIGILLLPFGEETKGKPLPQ
jgi:MFS family permease